MRRAPMLIFVTLLAALQRVAAQQPGDRIRVTIGSGSSPQLLGTFLGQDADSFWVQLVRDGARVAVARNAVVRLETSRGHKRAIIAGASVGVALGTISGFVLSSVAASKSRSCGTSALFEVCYVEWYERGFRGGVMGGAIGAVVGAALGYAVRTERWDGVPLSRVHHLALAPRGSGLAFSWTP